MYTIGQVSEMFGLPISTLRYYDKQGLFPEKGILLKAKGNTGGGNCPYEPSVGYAEIQVLVLWAGIAGWQRRSGAEHDS